MRAVVIGAGALGLCTAHELLERGVRDVTVLDARHAVHYRDVQLGRDFGDEIEVLTGLNAGDTVVIHPGDDIPEGTVVEAVPLPK